jgi:hypothetical protein
MFKAGAVARLNEIVGDPGMEKSAFFGAASRMGGRFLNKVTGLPGKAKSLTHTLTPQTVTGASGASRELLTPQMRPWAKHVFDNRGRYSAGATAGAGLVGGNMYANSERQNMLDNYQQIINDYQKSRKLDTMWGRTKAMLGYLTGGQNYTNQLMGEMAQFGANNPNLSRGNRNMLAEWATRRGFAPNNTVVSN